MRKREKQQPVDVFKRIKPQKCKCEPSPYAGSSFLLFLAPCKRPAYLWWAFIFHWKSEEGRGKRLSSWSSCLFLWAALLS